MIKVKNIEEVEDHIKNIQVAIDHINDACDQMQQTLKAASYDFTSINFERAKINTDTCMKRIEDMKTRLTYGQDYIEEITECLKEYQRVDLSRVGFRGPRG